jgi:serine protease Do
MKRYLLFLAAVPALISLSAKAQDEEKAQKEKKKEIIIRDDKPKEKTVIVIEDGKVTINGKPASDWGDGNVVIRSLNDENRAFIIDRKNDLTTMKSFFALDGENVRLGVFTKENEKGAEISSVSDSSAAFKAGLKEGDIITKVNETPISDPEALSKMIHEHKPGDVVTVHYLRGDHENQARVTLEKPHDEFRTLNFGPQNFKFKSMPFIYGGHPRLGAHIQDTEDTSGVKVLRVDEDSPAAKAGLQKDDVITAIDGKKVSNIDEASDILGDGGDKYNYSLTVTRGGNSMTLQVKIPHQLNSTTL